MGFRMIGALVLGAACVGCGGDVAEPPVTTTAQTGPGPCDLLSPDEILGILGEQVRSGEEAGYECSYTRPADAQGIRMLAVKLRLEFGTDDPFVLLNQYQATLRSALGEYDPISVSGVGDAAAWDGDTFATTFAINPGRTGFVSVQLTNVDANLERRIAQELATKAVANFKK